MNGAAAFRRACALDVAVRKPGNVSRASPGHGMQAAQFIASAQAAAGPLFAAGSSVGARIEAAVAASWQAAGCNTNLGIVLLCAPIAAAMERTAKAASPVASAQAPSLRPAIESVLAELTVADARAAYRGIAKANPGGLGEAPQQDVHDEPAVDLRTAMALAADRDRIARQYRDGYRDLLDIALPALPRGPSLVDADEAVTAQAVQRLYLRLLSRFADSHIVRKHGAAVAQNVMSAAQPWAARAEAGEALDADPAFIAWDERLKSIRVNPGTTADLTVATLLLAFVSG